MGHGETMTKEKKQAFAELHCAITTKLMEIGDECYVYGLSALTEFTLIARDPNNDDMCLVVTNEDAEGLQAAVRVALNNAKLETVGVQ